MILPSPPKKYDEIEEGRVRELLRAELDRLRRRIEDLEDRVS